MENCPSTDNCPTKVNAAAHIAMLNKMAFQSMREASEYGTLIQFVKSTFEVSDNQGLLKAFFLCVDAYELNCIIQIREEHFGQQLCGTFVRECKLANPDEEETLRNFRHCGRIVDIPDNAVKRTVFNGKHISFLVNNMPDDADDYGRKKDVLAVLLEGFEACLVSLKKQEALRSILRGLISLHTEGKDIEDKFSAIVTMANTALEK